MITPNSITTITSESRLRRYGEERKNSRDVDVEFALCFNKLNELGLL
jgi:hypothetical protein